MGIADLLVLPIVLVIWLLNSLVLLTFLREVLLAFGWFPAAASHLERMLSPLRDRVGSYLSKRFGIEVRTEHAWIALALVCIVFTGILRLVVETLPIVHR